MNSKFSVNNNYRHEWRNLEFLTGFNIMEPEPDLKFKG